MVTERYIKKGGKTYGPYFYESYRDSSGKVRKRYLPDYKLSSDGGIKIFVAIAGIVALLLLFFIFLNQEFGSPNLTGNVIYADKEVYGLGEEITGKVMVNLDPGEAIPADSMVRIALGQEVTEFYLRDFVDYEPVWGTFYAEGSDLGGEGFVFGIEGTKRVYQPVEFELEIYEERTRKSSGGSESAAQGIPEGGASEEIEDGEEEGEQESDSGGFSVDGVGSPITAQVISEVVVKSVNGQVIYGSDFIYELEEGQKVRVVEGSVKSNGEDLSESDISLEVEDDLLAVSTEYAFGEDGFGSEFNEGDEGMTFLINLEDLELNAVNEVLEIEISYGGKRIAYFEEKILVGEEKTATEELSVQLVQEIPSIRISPEGNVVIDLEDYFSGAERYTMNVESIFENFEGDFLELTSEKGFSGARKAKVIAWAGDQSVQSNEFLILVSSGAVSIETTRSQVRIGQKVEWTKRVKTDGLGEMNIEIPNEAENVKVKAVDGANEEIVQMIDGPVSLLTGGVIIEVDYKKQKESRINLPIVKSFKAWFANFRAEFSERLGVTGRVGYGASQQPEGVTDIILGDLGVTDYIIEYETLGPEAIEEETANGKLITITSEVEGYTNVIAFTELDNSIPVGSSDKIKLYWHRYDDSDVGTAAVKVENVPVEEVVEAVSTPEEMGDPILVGHTISTTRAMLGDYVMEEVLADRYDIDGDGNIDYIEWVVPHLSNQTYEVVIEITNAEHLDEEKLFVSDIYGDVSILDGVWSETIPDGHYVRVVFEENLTSENDIALYPRVVNGTPSIEIYEFGGTEKIAEFETLMDNEYNKVYLMGLVGEQDAFDLKIVGGSVEFDHIIDPSDGAPRVEFGDGTTSSGTQTNNDIYVNLSANDTSDLYAFVDFDDDVLLWARMDDTNASGDPTDLSSYSNNGTKQGNAAQTDAGYFGKGFEFDGNGDSIRLPGADKLNLSVESTSFRNYTFSFWLKRKTPLQEDILSIFEYECDASGGYALRINKGNLSYKKCDGASGMNVPTKVSDVEVPLNTWAFVTTKVNTAGSDPATIDIDYYLNGVYADSISSTVEDSSFPLEAGKKTRIGISFDGQYGWWGFNGTIDEVLIFNRSLSSGEILSLYNASASQYLNNFTELEDNRSYVFQGFAVDKAGNLNQTETRSVHVSSVTSTSVDSCSILSTPNMVYVQTANINANVTTCMNITAENVTFNGNDFWIRNTSLEGIGIYSDQFNTTIRNVNVTLKNSNTYGIKLQNSNYSQVYQSTFNDQSYGIGLVGSNFVILEGITANSNQYWGVYINLGSTNNQLNDITTNLNQGSGIGISRSSTNNQLNGITTSLNQHSGVYINLGSTNNQLNNITVNSNKEYGLYINSDSNGLVNVIANNNTLEGIFFDSQSNNNDLNNITANSNQGGGIVLLSDSNSLASIIANNNTLEGISLFSSSNNDLVDITVSNNGNGIIFVSGSNNNQLSNMIVNSNRYGISLGTNSNNNTFAFGSVNASSQDAIYVMGSASLNVFRNISITNTDASHYDIRFEAGSVNGTQLIDMPNIGNYTFIGAGGTFAVKNSQFGEIKFLQGVNGSGTNFTEDVRVLNNSATVRSDVNVGLNKSANITLYYSPGAGFIEPVILKDGVQCLDCYNFTSLSAETVVFNVTSWSNYSIGELASEADNPDIEFVLPTPNDKFVTESTSFTVKVNVTTYGGRTVDTLRYRLFNSSLDLINETYLAGGLNLTYWGLEVGNYTYSVWVNDSAGSTDTTMSRTISIIPSCLDLSGCVEGFSCVVGEECVLHTGLCAEGGCNFTVMIIDATIYTGHDSNGDANDLALTLTSNTMRAPLTFLTGAKISFSGANGTDLGSGGLGGDGGVINITVPDLLNTTNAVFVGHGGYTTSSGVGGDGGDLVLNYHGLIRNFTGSIPDLGYGNSAAATPGQSGNLYYNKDMSCPRDADVTGDGEIDISERNLFRNLYNFEYGEEGFFEDYDINCDNKLNVIELARVGFEIHTR